MAGFEEYPSPATMMHNSLSKLLMQQAMLKRQGMMDEIESKYKDAQARHMDAMVGVENARMGLEQQRLGMEQAKADRERAAGIMPGEVTPEAAALAEKAYPGSTVQKPADPGFEPAASGMGVGEGGVPGTGVLEPRKATPATMMFRGDPGYQRQQAVFGKIGELQQTPGWSDKAPLDQYLDIAKTGVDVREMGPLERLLVKNETHSPAWVEYNDYVKAFKPDAKHPAPMTFTQYQNEDANRKLRQPPQPRMDTGQVTGPNSMGIPENLPISFADGIYSVTVSDGKGGVKRVPYTGEVKRQGGAGGADKFGTMSPANSLAIEKARAAETEAQEGAESASSGVLGTGFHIPGMGGAAKETTARQQAVNATNSRRQRQIEAVNEVTRGNKKLVTIAQQAIMNPTNDDTPSTILAEAYAQVWGLSADEKATLANALAMVRGL